MMKEEGFVRGAIKIIRENNLDITRDLANQTLFTAPNKNKIQASAKASIAVAIDIYNLNHNDLDDLVAKACNARTVGGIKKIISQAEKIIKNRKS